LVVVLSAVNEQETTGNTMASVEQLNATIRPAVEAVGCEFVGIEYQRAGKHSVLRVFIDHADGISVEQCADASRQISALLDVEDPIADEYQLEVSSPGAERPIFSAQQALRFVGEEMRLRLRSNLNGQRNFRGRIIAVMGEVVQLHADGVTTEIDFKLVEQANLIPNW